MDCIIAKGLVFYGKHGVLKSEKENPQRFEIDLVLHKNLHEAGVKDDLLYTVDYAAVFNDVKNIVENTSFNLIEALAEEISDTILNKYEINSLEITVYKPEAPVAGIFRHFAIKIERNRK